MKMMICCPDGGCGSFQQALQFLRSNGIEPSIGADAEDGHYFDFVMPKDRAFYLALAERIGCAMPCCCLCYKEDGKSYRGQCGICTREFVVCHKCVRKKPKTLCPFC